MKKELLSVSKNLKALGSKIGKIIKAVEKAEKSKPKAGKKTAAKKKPAAKKKKVVKKAAAKKKTAAKKAAGEPTAYSTILGIIGRSKSGVNTSQLKAKTKFDDKKIANLIYKAKKQGKIKSVSKGVYKKK